MQIIVCIISVWYVHHNCRLFRIYWNWEFQVQVRLYVVTLYLKINCIHSSSNHYCKSNLVFRCSDSTNGRKVHRTDEALINKIKDWRDQKVKHFPFRVFEVRLLKIAAIFFKSQFSFQKPQISYRKKSICLMHILQN